MRTANCGTSPLSMTLTKSFKADGRRDTASGERRWPGRRPSGPPNPLAWNYMIPLRTSSSEATAGTTDPSGGSEGKGFLGAEGCFYFKALSVSPSWGAKPSAHSNFLNCLTQITLSKFGRYSSLQSFIPLMDSIPPSHVDLINRATCCLTSVETETCLSPPDSPGHPKPYN